METEKLDYICNETMNICKYANVFGKCTESSCKMYDKNGKWNDGVSKQEDKMAIKGFIEVTLKEKDVIILINIQYIQMVVKNCIAMQDYKQSLVYTKETYEEIKELIKKAMD